MSTPIRSFVESLEPRQLLAGMVQDLPYVLDFDRFRGGVVDKDGQGTGFTVVQGNTAGDEYEPSLIDIKQTAGILSLTSRGDAAFGGNYREDNTLANGLQTQFDASAGTFQISTTIRGPLGYINVANEQAGILFGPSQDNYLKLVVGVVNGNEVIQFLDEQDTGSGIFHQNGLSGLTVGIDTATITTSLELILTGDPAAGQFTAAYRIDGGALQTVPGSVTFTGAQRDSFFRDEARAGLLVIHKNNGTPITADFDQFKIESVSNSRPTVAGINPENTATDVLRDAFIATTGLNLIDSGLDVATVNSDTVELIRTSDNVKVPAAVNTTGGGDAIVLTPSALLDANTNYTFRITAGVLDEDGLQMVPFTSTFTTGATATPVPLNIAFEKVELQNVDGRQWTSVSVGPDGRLWGTTFDGFIFRYDIESDGTLSARQTITSLRDAEGAARLITGLEWDPRSTPANPIAWVTHTVTNIVNAPDFTSKLTRLTGSFLETVDDVVVGFPRSIRDHLTNQPDFGPDGKLYIPQAGNTAFGAPDAAWGNRPERLLSASVLVADTDALEARLISGDGPLDVTTEGVADPYDPFDPSAPVQIYATGFRNIYELVWHSNGNLYGANNGSAAGGNTPSSNGVFNGTRIDGQPYTGGPITGVTNAANTQPDTLYRIEQGSYYGHPNPTRGEFVSFGGNPTSGPDAWEFVPEYPVGTQPDVNFAEPIFSFGNNFSPNGTIEYQSNTFGGALQGRLLVTRYSGGDDLLAVRPNNSGGVASVQAGIPGLTGFVDPLDVTEDLDNGNLYVAEYGGQTLTLLRPVETGGVISAPKRSFINDPRGSGVQNPSQVTIFNNGTEPLLIPTDGLSLLGGSGSKFELPALSDPIFVDPGEGADLPLNFNPDAGDAAGAIFTDTLIIRSSATNAGEVAVNLRGLVTKAEGGSDEPSLQQLFELYEFDLETGDSDPTTSALTITGANDDINADRFRKAGPGPVSIVPLAGFGPDSGRPTEYGIYSPGSPQTARFINGTTEGDDQTVNVKIQGPQKFNVDSLVFGQGITSEEFGVVGRFNKFVDDGQARVIFSESTLNFWEPDNAFKDKVKTYPLVDGNGTVVPNAYVVVFEESTNAGFPSDFQDAVMILRNVEPVLTSGPEIGFDNLDGQPYSNRLVFSRIDTAGLDPVIPNEFKDTAKVRVRNTGDANLVVSNVNVQGQFTLLSDSSFTVGPGGFEDVLIQFTASGTITRLNGFVEFSTNDADEPFPRVQLAGYSQSDSEDNSSFVSQEPTLQTMFDVYGFSTVTAFAGQDLNGGGRVEAIGEEVLSFYWEKADEELPVRVQQLAAYHMQGDANRLRWFPQNNTSQNNEILRMDGAWSQSFQPRLFGSTDPAIATFDPGSTVFGLRVENESSDSALNVQEQGGGGFGHHMRFYPARDREGRSIPDTYLMSMDFAGINYDYNDNLYLIQNVKPSDKPEVPRNLGGYSTGDGVFLDWADQPQDRYAVFRATTPNGQYTNITGFNLNISFFNDTDVVDGQTYYYQVIALDADDTASEATSVVVEA
ncbi:MAG: Ig-like domain-containing protein [Planctomycetota bacterium]